MNRFSISPLNLPGGKKYDDPLLNDYAEFYVKVLGYDRVPHQIKWCKQIQANKNLLLLAPACHGKSNVVAGFAIWHLCRNRRMRIGILTATESLAKEILIGIQDHLEINRVLIEKYGNFKPYNAKSWSKLYLTVEGKNKGGVFDKNASITVGGAHSSWKGKRLDLLLSDDLIDPKNSDNQEKCQRLTDWFWETIYTRLEPWGLVKMIGTPESEADIYHDLMKNKRGFDIIHQKAIIDDLKKEVLWPEKWTYARLAEMRGVDFVAFAKHYQTTVINGEAAKISKASLEKLFDASVGFYPHDIPKNIRDQFKYILMGVDPAWTTKKRSKYSVIITVGIRHDGRRQFLDIWRDKVEYDVLFKWIETKYNMLRPKYVIVETNQLQERLRQEVASKGIPTIASYTSFHKNDLDIGIPMLYSLVSANLLVLPCADKVSRDSCQQFVNELIAYPNGLYSDVLMAYYLIEKEVRKNQITAKVINRSVLTGKKSSRRFSHRYGLVA